MGRGDGVRLEIAIDVRSDGKAACFDPPPVATLPPTPIWRMPRAGSRDRASVARTLEDTPFYSRSVLDSRLLDETVVMMHESVSMRRFEHGGCRRCCPSGRRGGIDRPLHRPAPRLADQPLRPAPRSRTARGADAEVEGDGLSRPNGREVHVVADRKPVSGGHRCRPKALRMGGGTAKVRACPSCAPRFPGPISWCSSRSGIDHTAEPAYHRG